MATSNTSTHNPNAALQVKAIPFYNDNYIWVIYNSSTRLAVAVDPGSAQPLLDFLQKEQLKLIGLLITHHHHDHTGGIVEIQNKSSHKVPVYGPASENIEGVTHQLKHDDTLTIEELDCHFTIIHTPGHTLGHICYFTRTPAPWLFCGDTLFSIGCGRLFEGSHEQMHHSLQLLEALPDQTLVFCAHEYTLANLGFALKVEPENHQLMQYQEKVQALRQEHKTTLPTTIGLEKALNPFMRSGDISLARKAENRTGHSVQPGLQTFTVLREWKDVS